jgi:hypothetical protein
MLNFEVCQIGPTLVPTEVRLLTLRDGLRVCGTQDECSVQLLRALKNVVQCRCVLDSSSFVRTNEDK